jgi:hypothetical protein
MKPPPHSKPSLSQRKKPSGQLLKLTDESLRPGIQAKGMGREEENRVKVSNGQNLQAVSRE